MRQSRSTEKEADVPEFPVRQTACRGDSRPRCGDENCCDRPHLQPVTRRVAPLLSDDDHGPCDKPPDDEFEHTGCGVTRLARTQKSGLRCAPARGVSGNNQAHFLLEPIECGTIGCQQSETPVAGSKGTKDVCLLSPASAMAAPENPVVPHKKRTMKYYPPPGDDSHAKSVDVIDNGNEMLIITRESLVKPKLGDSLLARCGMFGQPPLATESVRPAGELVTAEEVSFSV